MTDYYDHGFTWHTYAGKRNLRIKIKRALRWLGLILATWMLIAFFWNFYTSF